MAWAAPELAASATGMTMSAPWAMKVSVNPRTPSASEAKAPSCITGLHPRTWMEVPVARL